MAESPLKFRIARNENFRISLIYLVIFSVLFLILLTITYKYTTDALVSQIRQDVQGQIDSLVSEISEEGASAMQDNINERLRSDHSGRYYYAWIAPDGKLLTGNTGSLSPRAGWSEIVLDPKPPAPPVRVWGIAHRWSDGSMVYAGADARTVIETQQLLFRTFVIVGLAGVVFSTIIGLAISLGYVRRIDAISEVSQAIMAGQLRMRIPVRGGRDEIDRLSIRLNHLFDNNEALLGSLRHMTASIAHELRTPLARLHQGLEHARNTAATRPDFEAAFDTALQESRTVLEIFSALLRIAQIESGARRAEFRDVDLVALFEDVASLYRAVAEDAGHSLTLELDVPGPVAVRGDRMLLVQMLSNMVENAIHHTPAGTRIHLSLWLDDKTPVASLADTGPGIAPEYRTRVFERFFRVEGSRHAAGTGLGLAVAGAIANLHGTGVEIADNAPGTRLILRFDAQET